MSTVNTTSCNWCLQKAPVQIIKGKLWHFWRVISNEDPHKASLKNICEKCKLRCEQFSTYTERWKSNEFTVAKVLTSRNVKDEFSIDMGNHPTIKEEISKTKVSDVHHTIASINKEKGDLESMVLIDNMDAPDEPEISLLCSFCGKQFSCSYRLKVHLRVHTGDKPFKCSYCNKAFAWSGNLICHLRIHTGEKPFQCPQCNKSFSQSGNLETHLRLHTGDKPLKCQQCNKTFAHCGTLISHQRSHTGQKPYKCLQCNRTFSHSSNLVRHFRVHTDNKPFKCSQCNKAFAHSGSLMNHLRVHTTKKTFKCTQCAKAFANSGGLANHLRVHTAEKPVEHSHCDKTFKGKIKKNWLHLINREPNTIARASSKNNESDCKQS